MSIHAASVAMQAPLSLSSNARRVLDLFRWYWRKLGGCWPKQRFIAAKIGKSVETVKRAVKELLTAGLVKIFRHGPRGATYTEAEQVPVSAQLDLDFDTDSSVPSLLTEVSHGKHESKNAPAVPVEKIPPPPGLRLLPQAVRGVLQRCADRIARARNPAAYRQSIIRCEWNLIRWREQFPPKPVRPLATVVTKDEEEGRWKHPGSFFAQLQDLGIV
jgi:hypothetical protein